MTPESEKILAMCEFIGVNNECDGCGLGETIVEQNPHIPIIKAILADREQLLDAMEFCWGHWNTNDQKRKAQGYKVTREALTASQATDDLILKGEK